MTARPRLLIVIVVALGAVFSACDGPTSPAPAAPTAQTGPLVLDRAQVIDALDYWQSAAGITYVLIDGHVEPRLHVRPGTDGLAPQGGGRALIDGTYPEDNRARSGLAVFEPGGGNYCRTSAVLCRSLYRHEIGHALGFLGHSDVGLMAGTTDALTDTERRMMVALYSLPHGARVQSDGSWSVGAAAASGVLADPEAAVGIILWNMNAPGGASYRQQGIITRWELPVRVYIQP